LDERIMAGEVRVTRRRHILAAGGAFLLLAAAHAQTPKRFRVACLWANDPESIASLEKAFVDGLREQGYVVGRNLVLDMRYARGDNSRMPALADELIGLRPDVVIGIESVAIVMRSKTKSIPIVSYCFTKSGGSRARKDARAAGYQCHGDGLPL
jgi:putative ABC transport system substrate-binding protein